MESDGSKLVWRRRRGFCIGLCVAVLSIVPVYAQTRSVMRTSELIGLCTSADVDEQQVCDGYHAAIAHLWTRIACPLSSVDGQAYCSGATDADRAFDEALEPCAEACSSREAEPTTREDALALEECIRTCASTNLADSLRCAPDEAHSETYCLAYNVAMELNLVPAGEAARSDNGREWGMSRGVRDHFMYAFMSVDTAFELYDFVPCLETWIRAEDLRDVFLDFVDRNPESLGADLGDDAVTLEELDIAMASMAMDRALSSSVCSRR